MVGIRILLLAIIGATSAGADEVEFRRLTPSDFRGENPPWEVAGHPAGLDAVSCLRVSSPAGLPVTYSERTTNTGHMVTATLAEPRFVAAFDRACSWWAPDVKDPDYALIHEQVHFAITEHAARQLTREFADSARAIRGRGTSRKAAEAQLMQRIRMLANLKQSESSAQHDEFDAATRADRAPESQQVWVRRYQKLLGVPPPDPESVER